MDVNRINFGNRYDCDRTFYECMIESIPNAIHHLQTKL